MKKYFIILLVLFCSSKLVFGQKVELILNKKIGHVPLSFKYKSVSDEDSSNIAIPSNIKFKYFNRYFTYIVPIEETYRSYRYGKIDSATFSKRMKIYHTNVDTNIFRNNFNQFPSSKVHFISGIDENGNKIILVDADQNGIISKDEIFKYSSDTLKKIDPESTEHLGNINLKQQAKNGGIRTLNVNLIPLPDQTNYSDERKKATAFYLRKNEYWEGSYTILKDLYTFYFESKPFSNEINSMQYRIDYLGVLSKKFYSIKDEYSNDKITLILDSVSILNDKQVKIFLSYQSPPVKHNDTTFAMSITNVESSNNETLKTYLQPGKYVLLDYWGTWCAPCIEKLPHLKELQSKYTAKLNLVSVAYDYDIKAVLAFDTKNNIAWHSYYIDRNKAQSLVRALDVTEYPTFKLYDSTGKLVFTGHTEVDLNEIEKIITK